MIGLSVRVNTREVELALADLGPGGALAAMRALNRTMATEQTETVRAIQADMKIAQKFIRKVMVIKKATLRYLVASLSVSGRRLPLIAFNARGPRPSRGRGRGVSYDAGRGRKIIPSAFILRVASAAQREQGVSHEGVFKRVGRKRLPILELQGPSIPLVFGRPKIRQLQQRVASTHFFKNLKGEAEFILRGRRTA